MRYKWLNYKQNKKLIVFFNGWGMDESVVNHLEAGSYDVLMFYDYNTLNTDFDFSILDRYNNRILVGWSMGVMTAALFDKIKYDRKIAINGTLMPINDEYGIPERIYNLTIKGFNEKGREKFIKSMFSEKCELPVIARDLDNQKNELSALKVYKVKSDFKYDKIWISSNDKIIPAKNQIAFWKQEANLNSGHCPFFLFKSWEELL